MIINERDVLKRELKDHHGFKVMWKLRARETWTHIGYRSNGHISKFTKCTLNVHRNEEQK